VSDLIKDNLCSNDPRSTFYIELDDDPRPARENCFCENCFYGKDKLAVRIAELEKVKITLETLKKIKDERIAELELKCRKHRAAWGRAIFDAEPEAASRIAELEARLKQAQELRDYYRARWMGESMDGVIPPITDDQLEAKLREKDQ